MDRTKRKLTFAELSAVKTKKLQNKTIQSITSIENLCDELFYEIFDYLYVNNIYQAFSNLNYRFEQILHASWPLLHYICYHTTSEISSVNDSYKQFLAHNKHKIVSLHLYFYSSTNDLFQFITIDASFSCLESILINENRNDGSLIILLLRHLVCLPRLFFLSICTGKLNDPDNLFQLIFALSQLKSCRFTYFSERDIALPIATRKQHSTIETLALYTVDTWNEILTLTSYTSNLRRLITPCGMDRDIDIETLLPLRLSNLTYLRTCFNYLNFHEFEIFIKKIYSPLKILHVEFLVEDVNFRDSDCWENLILTSLSHLEELYLIYKERFPPSDDLIFSGKLNPFSSPFWIDRRWFFEVETDINFVNYIVRPYRKKWYEDVKNEVLHSSIEYSKLIQLTINDTDDDDFYTTSFILKHILTITNIHYLEIERSIDIPLFIRLLNALTDVETLKIYSIICDDRKVDYKKFSVASSIKKRSKIKNVYIKNVKNIDDIFLLMTLCPHITYLKIDNINVINQNVNVESIVNDFINRSCNNPTNLVRLLCFRIPAADDGTIEKLKRTIITNGITCDYTIKRIVDRVYIEWKLEPTIDSS